MTTITCSLCGEQEEQFIAFGRPFKYGTKCWKKIYNDPLAKELRNVLHNYKEEQKIASKRAYKKLKESRARHERTCSI